MSERMCRFDPGSGYKGDGFCHPFFVPGVGVEPDLCLGALPLLYPAAPPSVFAYFIGKYTALAVALGHEYVVGFLGVMMRDRSAGLGTGVVTAKYYTICIIKIL